MGERMKCRITFPMVPRAEILMACEGGDFSPKSMLSGFPVLRK